MKVRWTTPLLVAAALLSALTAPRAALADLITITVDPSKPQSSTNFPSIQSAIDNVHIQITSPSNAANSYQIQVANGTYTGPIQIKDDGVPLYGASTAGTILTGGGSGAQITTNGHSNVTIRNFTFKAPSAVGISASGGSLTITNDIFWLPGSTALQIEGGASATITNNTFYQNGTALSTTSTGLTVDNNIFSTNTTAIFAAGILSLSYNDYFANNAIGVSDLGNNPIPNATVSNADPQFVNALGGDFHLQSTSPCKDSGDPSIPGVKDRGAYGGSAADAGSSTPPTPTLTSTIIATDTSAVMTLNWSQQSSPVTAYRVYYSTTPNSVTATEGETGFVVSPATTTSAKLTFATLPDAPTAPTGAPVLTTTPIDGALQLSWTPILGATGYRIYYSTTSFTATSLPGAFIPVDASTTSYTLSGLTNSTNYWVAVQPVAQALIAAQVTSVVDSTLPSNPGSSNESTKSVATVQAVGAPVTGTLSNVQEDFPEAVTPFPNVKGGGCFIATAAYGFYSSPQVQSLRMFRDRFLLTNAPGRAFVAWYYQHGPSGARFLNAHPWLKAPVRVALFPLVVLAAFLVYTSPLMKVALVMTAAATSYFLYRRLEMKSLAGARRVS